MRKDHIAIIAAAALVLTGAIVAIQSDDAADTQPAAQTPTTKPHELVAAIPFTLDQPMRHWFRQEWPMFDRGALVAIRTVDAENLRARQLATPVLYCGDETVAIYNQGHDSGFAIGIVPFFEGDTFEDLAQRPIFFGAARLAEQVTATDARAELSSAIEAAMPVIGEDELRGAQERELALADENALFRALGDLVTRYSPNEHGQIAWLRGNH